MLALAHSYLASPHICFCVCGWCQDLHAKKDKNEEQTEHTETKDLVAKFTTTANMHSPRLDPSSLMPVPQPLYANANPTPAL